ncbi:MAG: hypothetical protein RML72_03220 [Bacteroidia bacterium]|nr:hypothetical protein [Bacteroidia bacterium]MDW8157872.1 hypothetical protein [Bacteroidia bacterium]
MLKLIASFILAFLFALQLLACGEKAATASQSANPAHVGQSVCPSMQRLCPGQAGKSNVNNTQVVFASNTQASEKGMCNTTCVALSMIMGLGIILGASLIGNKIKL